MQNNWFVKLMCKLWLSLFSSLEYQNYVQDHTNTEGANRPKKKLYICRSQNRRSLLFYMSEQVCLCIITVQEKSTRSTQVFPCISQLTGVGRRRRMAVTHSQRSPWLSHQGSTDKNKTKYLQEVNYMYVNQKLNKLN